MPSVSVVVPIYNTEVYLPKCVDSLLSQSLGDVEVVLVDDGSTDSSGAIADEYARRDSRVKVVHRENGGLGPARNSGMAVCTGDYIGFVDSDDWVEARMYERLYSEADAIGADIVVSGHCDVTDGVKTYVKPHPLAGKLLEGESIASIREELYGHAVGDNVVESFPMSVCMSIYRRSMIEENTLLFCKVLSEDIFFNLAAYRSAYRISFTDGVDYCYRKDGQASITQSFSERKLPTYLDFIDKLEAEALEEPDECREACLMRVRRTAIDYARLYIGLIAQSTLDKAAQRDCGRRFIASGFLSHCEGFPVETLPFQQRVFHRQLLGGNAGAALMLARFRLSLKKGRR